MGAARAARRLALCRVRSASGHMPLGIGAWRTPRDTQHECITGGESTGTLALDRARAAAQR